MIDFRRLLTAYQTARARSLGRGGASGHWEGRLASSALSTAAAASALALVAANIQDPARRQAYGQLAERAVAWLAACQNPDGGWGDTDKSLSNVATTMLVQAAFQLAGAAGDHAELERARAYVESQGASPDCAAAMARSQSFAAPILTNCALAGMVPWREVPALPFEFACLPRAVLRFLRLSVVSYAIPALVAIGQARYFHRWPRNPVSWLMRRLAVRRSLRVLSAMQPPSGGSWKRCR